MNKMLLLLTLLALGSVAYAGSSVCQNQSCIAVVDAGSTGSRLHIYAYASDSNNTPNAIHEIYSKKIKPGLATLEPKAAVIRHYVNELFSNTPEANMPVYFYATAGMRLLSQPKQQAYYSAIKEWFKEHSEWQLVAAKTITGQEEAIDAWLGVNYQLGRINGHDADKGYVGVMDTGGASVQIVTVVDANRAFTDDELAEVVINGQPIHLYAASFLGLGQTLVTEQFLNAENCYPDGYRLPNEKTAKGDFYACRRELVKLINGVHAVDRLTQSAITSNAPKEWYVIGGLSAMVQTEPFNFTNQFTNQLLAAEGDNNVCHQQWQDLEQKYADNEFLYGYCLYPAYYYALLVDGYGFRPEQVVNFIPNTTSGADWSLGVVLHHSINALFPRQFFVSMISVHDNF